jgi:hypothetical protein
MRGRAGVFLRPFNAAEGFEKQFLLADIAAVSAT